MKRIPATLFIKKIGGFLRRAAEGPIVITSHGEDNAVLMSARDHRALLARTAGGSPVARIDRPRRRKEDALKTAVSVVRTSIGRPVDGALLLKALAGAPKETALRRIFFADVSAQTTAGLVNAGHTTWSTLLRALETLDGVDDEKASYIRDMATLELAGAARPSTPPSRR